MAGLLWMGTAIPAGYFAAPNGSATGAGTFADPWTLHQAMNLGGFPVGTVTAGDTVWLRGGTYTTPTTTADMEGTAITKVVTVPTRKRIISSTNPWVVGDVGKDITIAGAGTNGADLVTTISTFESAGAVQVAATIQVGTQFSCTLNGTSTNPITFRGYPGERVIIDGNFDTNIVGDTTGAVVLRYNNLTDDGRYLILRDVEITNSNPHRLISLNYFATDGERGDCVEIGAPHSKLINCILHNGGEGLFQNSYGCGGELYGNLIYYNGEYSPVGEADQACAVDLAPSGGSAVALSGSYTAQQTAGNPTLTIANHNNTGDYTLVAVALNGKSYTSLSATYDGAAMTRFIGIDGDDRATAMFGIAGHAGTHDVVVTTTSAYGMRGIAQSFSNVGSAAAGGSWFSSLAAPPFSANTASDTNHMVVDGINIYQAYGTNFMPSGDNTGNMIGGAVPGGPSVNPVARMSWATRSGAGNVAMGWTWTMNIKTHGHGMYQQNGGNISDGIAVNGNAVLTAPAPPAASPWKSIDVGAHIIVYGAGVAGADLVTTIAGYTNGYTITLAQAPSTSVNPAEVTWGYDRIIRDNIVLDENVNAIQVYGSSDADGTYIELNGNLFALNPTFFGGLTRYRMTNTNAHDNYTWDSDVVVGYLSNTLKLFSLVNNYIVGDCRSPQVAPLSDPTVSGNTITGSNATFAANYPANTYYQSPSEPASNLIVVRPNAYEANRANIYVYNWEGLNTVSVDISSAVSVGTPIYVMNAQDYFATPVWTGTYAGGSITLPQSGTLSDLTVEVPIGGPGGDAGAIYPTPASTGPAFAAFIVRAKSQEPWRG